MNDRELDRSIATIIDLYQDSYAPVVVTDAHLNVLFATEYTKRFYPVLSTPDGIQSLLHPNIVDSVSRKMSNLGEKELYFPLTGTNVLLIFTPVVEENDVKGFLITLSHNDLFEQSGEHHDHPRLIHPDDRSINVFTGQFREPLSNIFSALSVIGQQPKIIDAENYMDYIDRINSNAYLIYRNVINISEMIKFSSGINALKVENIDLKDFMSSLCEALYIQLKTVDATLDYDLPEESLVFSADRNKLTMSLVNLVSNSCKYTDKPCHIRIAVRRIHNNLHFSVTDDGFGIPAAIKPYIFQPYYSYDHTTQMENPHQTGLGLTLVRHSVALHGGTIALDSTEDKGTTVAFTIPIENESSDVSVLRTNTADYLRDRFSYVYIGLSDVCRCPDP